MNPSPQAGSSGDRVRLRINLPPGALGVNGESGAGDLKLPDSGREPGVERRP